MFLLILVAFLIITLISWVMLLSDCKRLNIPGPLPLPFLGNGLIFLGDSAREYPIFLIVFFLTFGIPTTYCYLFFYRLR